MSAIDTLTKMMALQLQPDQLGRLATLEGTVRNQFGTDDVQESDDGPDEIDVWPILGLPGEQLTRLGLDTQASAEPELELERALRQHLLTAVRQAWHTSGHSWTWLLPADISSARLVTDLQQSLAILGVPVVDEQPACSGDERQKIRKEAKLKIDDFQLLERLVSSVLRYRMSNAKCDDAALLTKAIRLFATFPRQRGNAVKNATMNQTIPCRRPSEQQKKQLRRQAERTFHCKTLRALAELQCSDTEALPTNQTVTRVEIYPTNLDSTAEKLQTTMHVFESWSLEEQNRLAKLEKEASCEDKAISLVNWKKISDFKLRRSFPTPLTMTMDLELRSELRNTPKAPHQPLFTTYQLPRSKHSPMGSRFVVMIRNLLRQKLGHMLKDEEQALLKQQNTITKAARMALTYFPIFVTLTDFDKAPQSPTDTPIAVDVPPNSGASPTTPAVIAPCPSPPATTAPTSAAALASPDAHRPPVVDWSFLMDTAHSMDPEQLWNSVCAWKWTLGRNPVLKNSRVLSLTLQGLKHRIKTEVQKFNLEKAEKARTSQRHTCRNLDMIIPKEMIMGVKVASIRSTRPLRAASDKDKTLKQHAQSKPMSDDNELSPGHKLSSRFLVNTTDSVLVVHLSAFHMRLYRDSPPTKRSNHVHAVSVQPGRKHLMQVTVPPQSLVELREVRLIGHEVFDRPVTTVNHVRMHAYWECRSLKGFTKHIDELRQKNELTANKDKKPDWFLDLRAETTPQQPLPPRSIHAPQMTPKTTATPTSRQKVKAAIKAALCSTSDPR
jgi:hypothetical protein